MWLSRPILLAGALTLTAACSDDSEMSSADDPDALTADARFLVHTAVQSDDTRTNYFSVVSSLSQERKLDYGQALELPGRPRLYAAEGVGFFAIGAGESPTITRYELGEGLQLVAGESLSLQSEGVSKLGAQAVLFVSPTKAYYKDDVQGQVIVWNPEAMTVEGTVPLPDALIREGSVLGVSDWASRDGEAFFAVSWSNETYDRVRPGSALVRLDTETDELSVVEDDRCRDLATSARIDDTLYFFSGVINGLGFAAAADEDGGQADCILRVNGGEQTFDPDYVGSVAEGLGDDKVGTVISVTEDGKAWVQVADLKVTPRGADTTYSEWYSRGWSWWNVSLDALDKATRVQEEQGAYSGFAAAADTSFFVSTSDDEYENTTLVELSSGTAKPGLSFTGFVLDVARLR
ncbi:MAG: MxcI [Polyangiales bacterium]